LSTTLLTRVTRCHIYGALANSTFRRSLAAIIREPLRLEVIGPVKVDSPSEERLSVWICRHLTVTIGAFPDRHTLNAIEDVLLAEFNPPQNLKGMPSSPIRLRVRVLRGALRHSSR
jgi:hypothetical protein